MNPKVLVIDDEDAARYGMVRVLAGMGCELREAGDGLTALGLIEEFQPDVVLSDINMPGMDGLTLLRTINERASRPLVVLITAYGSEKMAIEALRAGAYDYIAKPYELDELRNSIRNAVERQKLVRELEQSQAALIQSRKLAALAELVAGVAHEINNPLAVLQSTTQTIREASERLGRGVASPTQSDQERSRLLAVLEQSSRQSEEACRRITRTVSNLAQFAQLDRADFQRFQLNDCVTCTASLIEPQAGSGIRLEIKLGELPPVEGSVRDMNQVVYHLLQNAAEAIRRTPGPGVVTVLTAVDGDRVRLEVSDNGCGIPEERLSSIFDPGFTTKGVKVGIGVGLAICFQVVEAHRGRILVCSKVGVGSKFTVLLPVTQSP